MAMSRLIQSHQEFEIDLNATGGRPLLKFNNNRQWISVENANSYLREYAKYQQKKYDPPVFPDESTDRLGDVNFQRRRQFYFNVQARLKHLHVLEAVKHWPNAHGIPTRAPFISCSENTRTENLNNRNTALVKALAVPELGNRIVCHLGQNFSNLGNLSQACWATFDAVHRNTEHWDMTNHDFLRNDEPEAAAKGRPIVRVLTISQVRPEMNRTDTARCENSYSADLAAMKKLFRALKNRASMIEILHFHRIPFMNEGVFECIVSSLPHLQDIGVYQCPLLPMSSMIELLTILRKHKKPSGFVHLDFFPTFHEGPNSIQRKGSFGATWEEAGMDTTAGIVKLVVYHHYPMARDLGFDILCPGSAYRLWLEKCPLPDWTVVRVYEAIKTYEACRSLKNTSTRWMADTDDPAFKQLADDISAAVFTDNVEPGTIPKQVIGDYLQCHISSIQSPILKAFFPYLGNQCYGCMLCSLQKTADDHFKEWQTEIVQRWIGTSPENYTLTAVLADDSTKYDTAAHHAERLDCAWRCDKKYNHGILGGGTDRDLPWRSNFLCVKRRYRRFAEPHGPVNRRSEDRQYYPIGKTPYHVGMSLVSRLCLFQECFSPEREAEEVTKCAIERPHMANDIQALLKVALRRQIDSMKQKSLQASQVEIDAKVQHQQSKDMQTLVHARQFWAFHNNLPCRPAANWDEMRDCMMDRMERDANGGELIQWVVVQSVNDLW